MSVDRALQLWPILEKATMKLGSPATISPNVPWMIDFMAKAKKQGRRVDFVAAHIYQYPDARTFLRKVDEMYERWGKPVWITETAVADWNATPTRPSRYSRAQVNGTAYTRLQAHSRQADRLRDRLAEGHKQRARQHQRDRHVGRQLDASL